MLCLQLGSDEGDFTDKIIEEEFPEDWGDVDDKQEIFDENGWNMLHYSILKGYGNAVTVLVEEQEFGKCLLLVVIPIILYTNMCK